MSQVRKLQSGGSTRWGTFTKDGVVYDLNDVATRDRVFKKLQETSGEYGDYYDELLNSLRAGNNEVGDSIANRVSGLTGFEGNTNRENARLLTHETTRQKRRDARRNNGTHRSKQAIANFLAAFYTPEEKPQEVTKKKIANGPLIIDYDTVDGKSIYSKSNPSNLLLRQQLNDYLGYLQDPDAWGKQNEWETPLDSTKERALRAWYANQTDAKTAIDTAMAEVESKPWSEVSEATKELLAYFNIGGPSATDDGSVDPKGYVDSDGRVVRTQNDRGQWGVYTGNGKNGTINGALYTTANVGDRPYLINQDRLGLFDLGDEYLNSVVYGNRIYKPEEISQNVQLQQIMDNASRIINSSKSASEMYDALNGTFNYTDYGDSVGNYFDYDSSQHFIPNAAVRNYLKEHGIDRASMFNATDAYQTPTGETIYGIYDFSHNGDQTYGFRRPFYLIVGPDGQLKVSSDSSQSWDSIPYNFLNRNMSGINNIYARERIGDQSYGQIVAKGIQGEEYHFVISDSGKIYHVTNKGKLEEIDPSLAKKVVSGEPIARRDVDDSKKAVKVIVKRDPNWRPPITGRKNGGKIKELPLKYQMGSKLLASPTTVQDIQTVDDAMSSGSSLNYGWDNMSNADKKDITAAGLDLLGAVLALSPDPITSGAGLLSGLGATGLMTAADVERGNFSIGRTATSLGMDVLGAVPYVGSVAKITKITKAIAKNQKLLRGIQAGFIAAGFLNAVPTLNKLLKDGPKSLTTEDVYALSGALQATLGVGTRARQRAGDARLANIISENTTPTPAQTKHSAKMKYATDVEVKLKPEDVTEISAAGENAGNVLRGKLKGAYNVDPATIEADNTALLRRFGFEIKDGIPTPIEGTTHTASSKRIKGGTEDNFALAQEDVDYVLAGGENAGIRLRERLTVKGADPSLINTDDKALLKQFGFDVKMTKGDTPKIKSVSESGASLKERAASKLPQKNNYSKYGYITDLYRGAGRRRAYIDTAMKDKATRKQIDAALSAIEDGKGTLAKRAYGRSQFRIGEEPGVSGRWYSYIRPEEVEESGRTTGSKPEATTVTPETTTSAPATTPPPTTSPTTGTTGSTPTAKPVSTASVHTPEEIAAITGGVGSSLKPVTSSAEMAKRAANLERLRKSANPMEVLSELERLKQEKLLTSEEDVFAALVEILLRPKYRGMKKLPQAYKDEIFDELNRLIRYGRAYKQGGVIKATNGTPGLLYKINPITGKPEYSVSDFKITTPTFNPLPSTTDVPDYATVTGTIKPRATIENKTASFGGNYATDEDLTPAPKLASDDFWVGLGRYFLLQKGSKKRWDPQYKAADASLTQHPYLSATYSRSDSPSLQHEANALRERMGNWKSTTNDVVQNFALKSYSDSQVMDRLRDNASRQSQLEWQTNLQNAQTKTAIDNQNAEIADENAKRRALVEATKQKLKAAQETEAQASREQMLLELQNRIAQDSLTKGKAAQLNYQLSQQEKFDKYLQGLFKEDWEKWQNADQSEYSSFGQFVEQTNPSAYNPKRADIQKRYAELQEAVRLFGLQNQLNFPIAVRKKGGTLRGTTRYTLEPDERVWLENVKSAHRAIGKLSDDTIKLLLRALK